VRDHNGQALADVYFEDEPAAISGEIIGAGRGETDAVNIAKLPELLSRHKTWGVR
jgi:hypothetical protein